MYVCINKIFPSYCYWEKDKYFFNSEYKSLKDPVKQANEEINWDSYYNFLDKTSYYFY